MNRETASILLMLAAAVLLCHAAAHAQQIENAETAEQLQEQLDTLPLKEQVQTLNRLVNYNIETGAMEQAQELSAQMLSLAESTGDQELIRRALTRRAQSLYVQGKYGESMVYLQRLVELYSEAGNREREAGFRNFLANAAVEIGNNQLAITEYSAALELYESIGDTEGQAGVMNNIALIYRSQGNVEKELDYYFRALEIGRNNDKQGVVAIALSNIGESYRKLGRLKEAEDFLTEGLGLSRQLDDYDGQTYSLKELANLAIERKRWQEAWQYSRQAEELARAHGMSKELFYIHLQQGEILIAENSFAEATEKAEEAEALVRELDLTLEQAKPIELRSKIAEARGDYRSALELLKQYYQLEKEIEQQIKDERVMQLQAQFEISQREQDVAEARAQVERNQQNLRNLLVLTGLLLIMLALIYWLYLSKSRSNRSIREKNRKLEEAYERMETLASTDDLTGLKNRRALQTQIKHERDRQERSGKPFSFIIIDVDHFKQVNDQHGHDAGDRVLKWIANSILSMVRKQDAVCRWGGEEIILLLPETSREGASELAEKLVEYFQNNSFQESGINVFITITAGVAECGVHDSIRYSIEAADQAMYEGKAAGRNTVKVASRRK